ncbi:integrase, catalytic region, zinc finger, CCHC-type containing protein [Tanacetum coccineum]|uniref:Integrase, catalytic region, zinc finger, CCHC-type containing protein n=1 Tax=Tanacetum coccineum TaxID=301880 RepID=A0ABQ4Z2B9_9ASTR
MAAATDLDEIDEVNANCILMANLQQASTSGTQTDKAPVYDSDGSAEVHHYDNFYNNDIFNMFTQEEQYTELLEPIPEPQQVQQNDSNVIFEVYSVEQSGGTVDQHPITVEETRAYFESLYNNLEIEVVKVNTVNRKLRETNDDLTTELARYKNQEKCFEISQEKYDKLERCYQKSIYQEQCLTQKINALHLSFGKQITTLNDEISNLNNHLSKEKSTVSSLQEEKKKLKSDFKIREDELLDKQIQLENKLKELDNILVKTDFKSLAKEADESLAKHKDTHLLPPLLLQACSSLIDYRCLLVEQAKAKQPLDSELDFAYKYATRIQELLVYVQDTCPNSITPSTKKVVVSPMNNVKKVRFSKPFTSSSNIKQVVQIVLWYLDSRCSKHMTGNRSQLMNFVSKFLGTVRFRNDQIARIMGYGDYQLGNVIISRVYYVEGLGHNLFSVGQFCDADLEVAFQKNTCFIRNLEGVDLLSGSRDTNLYTISLDDMLKSSPICLLSKASKTKSWLWHRRLSHLNFGTLNKLAKDGLARGIPRLKFQKDHLCSACALGKSKKSSHQPKAEDTNQEKLYLLHMDLCGPMRVASINGKSSLCYPTNDSDDLGKLNAKADIGIFVGYAPAKKAFRIYSKRTRKIMETIHVTFDEITAMASEQFSSGPGLQLMTLSISISRLVPNLIPQHLVSTK